MRLLNESFLYFLRNADDRLSSCGVSLCEFVTLLLATGPCHHDFMVTAALLSTCAISVLSGKFLQMHIDNQLVIQLVQGKRERARSGNDAFWLWHCVYWISRWRRVICRGTDERNDRFWKGSNEPLNKSERSFQVTNDIAAAQKCQEMRLLHRRNGQMDGQTHPLKQIRECV